MRRWTRIDLDVGRSVDRCIAGVSRCERLHPRGFQRRTVREHMRAAVASRERVVGRQDGLSVAAGEVHCSGVGRADSIRSRTGGDREGERLSGHLRRNRGDVEMRDWIGNKEGVREFGRVVRRTGVRWPRRVDGVLRIRRHGDVLAGWHRHLGCFSKVPGAVRDDDLIEEVGLAFSISSGAGGIVGEKLQTDGDAWCGIERPGDVCRTAVGHRVGDHWSVLAEVGVIGVRILPRRAVVGRIGRLGRVIEIDAEAGDQRVIAENRVASDVVRPAISAAGDLDTVAAIVGDGVR